MKTVTLNILAKDIENTNYTNSYNCAMTRAFKRAGLNFKETGGNIKDIDTCRILCPTPRPLADKVINMYAYADRNNPDELKFWQITNDQPATPTEPVDFTFELELPD